MNRWRCTSIWTSRRWLRFSGNAITSGEIAHRWRGVRCTAAISMSAVFSYSHRGLTWIRRTRRYRQKNVVPIVMVLTILSTYLNGWWYDSAIRREIWGCILLEVDHRITGWGQD